MKIVDVKKLTVRYNGNVVGYLAELDGRIAFQYDREWQEKGFPISPFSLPISDKVFVCNKTTFGGLYGVFADSLPDGWGELLFVRMLKTQGIDAGDVPPLSRLSLINEFGMGALQYEPNLSEKIADERYELDELSAEAEKIWMDRDSDADLDKIYKLGGSSGGARPKVHLKIGADRWIVKFPCSYDIPDIGVHEFKANELARKAEICTNEFKLFPSKRFKGYFGAKRFDYEAGRRVHMVSLSSLLETSHRIPNLDYTHLLQVIDKICVDKEYLYEAFARMCFNVLFGNKDDHGKNFAFLYDENMRGYKLSPAYDITRTPDKAEHEMSVDGNGNPSETDLLAVATNCNLNMERCKKILERVKDVVLSEVPGKKK